MQHPFRAIVYFVCSIILLAPTGATVGRADDAKPAKQWVSWEGKEGPGKGKHIVFVAGANEYNPESGLPVLARILAEHHGFTTTVLFTINKAGEIDPDTNDNIPGLEALDHADLMVILCRFRTLPDDQMKHVVDYLESGRPVIGMRTATHSFDRIKATSPYVKFNWTNKDPEFKGGFGGQVLGETWIRHHAPNGQTSTRGIFAPGAAENPIFRGIKDGEIWGTTGVYGINLPDIRDCKVLLHGQVIEGNKETGKPVEGKQASLNEPMEPIAWTRTYSITPGKSGRVFTTTMGSAGDVQNEAFRRMIVNAAYWAMGMEGKIAEKSKVDIVGNPMPFKKGMTPAQMQELAG